MLYANDLLVKEGLDQSVWGLRIIAAEKLGHFNYAIDDLSGYWMSCACGELDDHIKRHADSSPIDETLYKVGLEFAEWIDADFDEDYVVLCNGIQNQFHGAAVSLVAIEKRSIELLKESLK
tara:strand:+ start:3229 stop:3591 length:363 start_codon:yes stop_codon:yes gene_type:complete